MFISFFSIQYIHQARKFVHESFKQHSRTHSIAPFIGPSSYYILVLGTIIILT